MLLVKLSIGVLEVINVLCVVSIMWFGVDSNKHATKNPYMAMIRYKDQSNAMVLGQLDEYIKNGK